MKTILMILTGFLVLSISWFLTRLISRFLKPQASSGQTGGHDAPPRAPPCRNAALCGKLRVSLVADAECMLDVEDCIHQLFMPFANYLDELLGMNDIAVILADHKEQQCVLLKRNGTHLDVMKLDYDHAIVRIMRDFEDGKAPCRAPWEQAGTPPAHGPGPELTDAPDLEAMAEDADADASRELRLLNDLYRIAVNKYNHNMHLRKLSEIDDLTGLSNHRHFQELLDREIKIAQRMNRPLALIMLDIDYFKNVNDTYGHQSGDLVLRDLARVARGRFRETDSIARYGGEEFAIILPGTSKHLACEVAERLREAVAQHEFRSADNQPLKITISLGVSDLAEAADRAALILAADLALYRAKQEGRNRVAG